MLEVMILSLWLGNLGIEMVLAGIWLNIHSAQSEQQEQEEEEILTRYDPETRPNRATDSAPLTASSPSRAAKTAEWEYKIVRSNRDIFRNPVIFQKLCQEEAESGWMLLEKLDDHRVRFKRPLSRRQAGKQRVPRFDPYRSQYGPSFPKFSTVLIVFAFLSALVMPGYLTYMLVSNNLTSSESWQPVDGFPPLEGNREDN